MSLFPYALWFCHVVIHLNVHCSHAHLKPWSVHVEAHASGHNLTHQSTGLCSDCMLILMITVKFYNCFNVSQCSARNTRTQVWRHSDCLVWWQPHLGANDDHIQHMPHGPEELSIWHTSLYYGFWFLEVFFQRYVCHGELCLRCL